jgi:uncharacterized membrane protein YdfJ with MMPL/SSD domain
MLLPVVALAVLLGLVLDQAVRSPSGWPRRGWSRTVGGAAVMVAVLFGALLVPAGAVTAAVAPAVLIGVVIGLVIGVLLDAVVVRLTLVPAAFTLLSRPAAAPPADAATRPVDAAAPAAGGHAARGVHSAEPDQPGRRVIEEALATPEARRGGRHRGG